MSKRGSLSFLAVLLFAFIVSSCGDSKAIVDDYSPINPATLAKGDTIMPFRYLHPEVADWKVEIRISGDDLLDVRKVKSRKFTATDAKVLHRIRKLRFVYGVGRPHKATSTLRIYDDIHLHEQYGVVFEKKYLAIQSETFGIMTCADQAEFFKILEEMY